GRRPGDDHGVEHLPPRHLRPGLPRQRHARLLPRRGRGGLYTLEGGQTATGSIVNWYREHFAGNEAAEARETGRSVCEVLDAKAAAVPPGCDGLVCLDYWQGNRCPLKDPRARGVLWGLTLSHGPGHVFRSVYEATAFGTRRILEDLEIHGF